MLRQTKALRRWMMVVMVGFMGVATEAKPQFGVHCASCHNHNREAMTVIGFDRLNTVDRQTLKTYTVVAGQTVTLSTQVTDGHNKYAVVLADLDQGGLTATGHKLVFTADPAWVNYTHKNPPYFASTASKHNWGSTRQFDFVLQLAPETPADTYALQFEVAGKNGGKWAQSERFFLEVLPAGPMRGDGDLDQDGDVDVRDFAQWAQFWQARNCTVDNTSCMHADIDADGDVDANDLAVMAAAWLTRKPLSLTVAASDDDAEESLADRRMDLTSTDLELVEEDYEQIVGLRFVNVPLDAGTYLTHAALQFTVDEVGTGDCQLIIEGQAADHAKAFTQTAGDISSRSRTQAVTTWTVPAWPEVGASSNAQRSPDLSAIIEEIIATPGWKHGNALVLLISGHGKRTAESFDGLPSRAPVLHLEFSSKTEETPIQTPPERN